MKTWLIGALVLALSTTLVPGDADAKRLGGGKSTGTQRSMPERTSPTATPPAQSPAATPGQQAAAPAAAAAPTAAAAAGKRSWMGPIAGLAAGLGIAALMSHLGLGEAFGNFLMMALLVVAAIALVVFIRRRMAGGSARQPALAGVGAGAGSSTQVAWPSATPAAGAEAAPMQRQAEPAFGNASPASASASGASAASSAAPVTAAFVPAAFDSEGFERVAKAIFIRLQAANDAANLDDLRQFTTPEMFAELKVDLLERGAAAQATEVKSVEARVIDVAEEGERQVVSVRYRGEVLEAAGAAAEKFDEVWHLVRPSGSQGGWAIAGIEQMPG
jgi:predicted lipid-binding transport protein (Tim44 family)